MVEINNIIFLKIQDGHLNQENVIEENSINWRSVDPYCPQFQQYEISENSSIVLGDIFVPGQVIVGFELIKESNRLSLGLLSRPLDRVLSEDDILYQKNYQVELEAPLKTQVIKTIGFHSLTNHRIYLSRFRKNYKNW